MTDRPDSTTALDAKTDRILANLGLEPDGPLEQLTFEKGVEFGSQLAPLLPTDRGVVREFAREFLDQFAGLLPPQPDAETLQFQVYCLAPYVSKFLTGRGLTVPQLARIAGVSNQQLYRLMRRGLAVAFVETPPLPRTGVNRRFSGLDGRQTHLTLHPEGMVYRKWPGDLAPFQGFLVGFMTGLRGWLQDPSNRAAVEAAFKPAMADMLVDPQVGELLDRAVIAVGRITTTLRDHVLTMKAEREKATNFATVLSELSKHRQEILGAFALTSEKLRTGRVPEAERQLPPARLSADPE